MPWSSGFNSALIAQRLLAMFVIERINLSGDYVIAGDPFAVLSHPASAVLTTDFPGASTTVTLVGEIEVDETPLDMRASEGGGSSLSFSVIGAASSLRGVYTQLPRGSNVALHAYLSDDDGATWVDEVVFRGNIRTVTRKGVTLLIEVAGIDGTAGLDRRRDGDPATSGRVLARTGGSPTTTLASAYNAGDAHIHVTSLPTWPAPTSPQKGVAVLVDPSTGDEFAVTYTGTSTSPDTLTGAASVSTVSTSSSALGGGDVVDAAGRPVASYKERIANDPPLAHRASGATVRFPAYYNGHPLQAALRFLISTGSGGAGTYDVLPKSWSCGIGASHIDLSDIAAEIVTTANALAERIEELDERSGGKEPGAFLAEFLSGAGFFVAMRQGQLTMRGVPDPYISASVSLSFTLADLDVDSDGAVLFEHEPWPEAFPAEIGVWTMSNAQGYHTRTYTQTLSSDTISDQGAWVLSDRWGPHGSSDNAVIEAGDRMSPSQMLIPDLFRLTVRGLRASVLAKGDFISLTVPGESRRLGTGLIASTRCVVLAVSTRWTAARVDIVCAAFPTDNPIDHDADDYTGQ